MHTVGWVERMTPKNRTWTINFKVQEVPGRSKVRVKPNDVFPLKAVDLLGFALSAYKERVVAR